MLLIFLLFIILLFVNNKNHFTNYQDIPNFIVYEKKGQLFKFNNNKLSEIKEYIVDKPIKLQFTKKNNEIPNIVKECNKKYSIHEFKYLKCKNLCHFTNIKDKHECTEKCEKYNTFSWSNCTKYFQNLIYNIN